MISSGIKRGLAVSAVSALAVTGIAGTAHAVTPVTAVTASAASASVLPYQTDNISIAGTGAGAFGTDTTVTLTVTQQIADNTAPDFSITGAGVSGVSAVTVTGTAAPYTAKATATVTLDAHGHAAVSVGSSVAGDVTATVTSAQNATSSAKFTVNKSVDAGGDATKVASITAPASQSWLLTDWENDAVDAPVVVAQAKDANTTVVGDVELSYQVSGQGVTGGPSSNVGPVEDLPAQPLAFGADPYSVQLAPSDLTDIPDAAGTYSVRVFADTNGNDKYDNGEPTSNTTIHITGNTYAWGTDTVTSSAGDKATGLLIKSGTTSVPVALSVTGTNGLPLANAPVGLDIELPDGSTTRQNVTTDASGKASTTVTVGSDWAKDGNTIVVTPYVSQSSEVGVGIAKTGATFTYADPEATVTVGGGTAQVQAVPGGQVAVHLTETDQWGTPMTHQLRFSPAAGALNSFTPQTVTPNADGSINFSYTDSKATVGASENIAVQDVTLNPATSLGNVNVVYVDSITAASISIDPASKDWGKEYAAGGSLAGFIPTVGVSSTVNNDWGSNSATDNDQAYTVLVTNPGGTPLVNSPVTFTVDKGFVATKDSTSATKKNADAAKTQTVWTNSLGKATVYVGSTESGTQTLTVTDGATTFKAAPVTYLADTAYSVTASLQDASLQTGQSTKLVAKVTDEFGNPATGSLVSFNQTGVGSFAGGASSIVFAQPDATGTVTATLDAGSTAGSGSVTASLFNALGGSPVVTVPVNPNATVSTPNYTGPVSVAYTVTKADTSTPGDNGNTGNNNPPAKPSIAKPKGKSKGKKDIVTAAVKNANGKRAVLRVHGKKVGTAKVVNGHVRFAVKDKNGNKKTAYTIVVAGVKKALKLK
jgi:hypothetical protein